MPTNSDLGSANSACALSAAARWSAGRSRGSWIPRNEAIASISRRQPWACAATSIRASFTSTGSRAIERPMAVSARDSSTAPSSVSCCQPSATARGSGGSMKGKSSTMRGLTAAATLPRPRRRPPPPASPNPSESMRRITPASAARRISGSVYGGRERKSASEYRRMQVPGAMRPQRPLRCSALACDTGSTCRRSSFWRGL